MQVPCAQLGLQTAERLSVNNECKIKTYILWYIVTKFRSDLGSSFSIRISLTYVQSRINIKTACKYRGNEHKTLTWKCIKGQKIKHSNLQVIINFCD